MTLSTITTRLDQFQKLDFSGESPFQSIFLTNFTRLLPDPMLIDPGQTYFNTKAYILTGTLCQFFMKIGKLMFTGEEFEIWELFFGSDLNSNVL